jgi:DNA-binding NtrC family response regulator
LSISEQAIEKLVQYNWPGNVRELQNVIERLAVLAQGNLLDVSQLPEEIRRAESRVASIV